MTPYTLKVPVKKEETEGTFSSEGELPLKI